MATYNEIAGLLGSSLLDPLMQKIGVASLIKAQQIAEDPASTLGQNQWAESCLQNPQSYSTALRNYIFAEFNVASTDQMINATDAQVQSAVDKAVDTLFSVLGN